MKFANATNLYRKSGVAKRSGGTCVFFLSIRSDVILKKVTALPFVIPSELRISYYAALKNDHVCGFL